MELTAIAAVARNGVIGSANDIPWHLPEDWKRFKAVTKGTSLIMGRRTFDGIGKPLPGRASIVLTRDPDGAEQAFRAQHPGALAPGTSAVWVSTLDEALAVADPQLPVYIGGGAEVYKLAWPRLTRLDITEVDAEPAGDAFFPAIDPEVWVEESREPRTGFDFVIYVRR